MNYTLVTYGLYLVASIAITVWVARTLHAAGRAFLVDAFAGREDLAESVNKLLVVGFYLVNMGFVSVFLRFGEIPEDAVSMMVTLTTRVGVVLLVLGFMHFVNVKVFYRMRQNAEMRLDSPPVDADARVAREGVV